MLDYLATYLQPFFSLGITLKSLKGKQLFLLPLVSFFPQKYQYLSPHSETTSLRVISRMNLQHLASMGFFLPIKHLSQMRTETLHMVNLHYYTMGTEEAACSLGRASLMTIQIKFN